MRVNIVIGSSDISWIAGRLARELVARLPAFGIEAAINQPKYEDLEYHQIVYSEPQKRPAVGMFTHGELRPKKFGKAFNGQIALNPVMLNYLRAAGNDNAVLIEMPVHDRFIRKEPLIFGVSGRTYADGRKGEHLVAKMVEAGYKVFAWGHGWPCPILSNQVEDLPAFYKHLDYFVDTSSEEGGSTPSIECMAMGIPVISHTLGVDRPVLAYETHNWDSLSKVLHRLTHPQTYGQWTKEHAEYFKRVVDQEVM